MLEALYYAATSKSHRTKQESDLTAYDAEGFKVEARVQRMDRIVRIEANSWHGTRRFKVNGVSQTRVSDILGKISVVLFTPEDIALIKGGASIRRTFLDMELSQLHADYLHALQQYRRVLRQRNELLRSHEPDLEQLDVWDLQLETHARILVQKRADYLDDMAQLAPNVYATITNGEPFSLEYKPDVSPDSSFAETLAMARETDLKRRLTSRGPHRDDFEIRINDHPARTYASQGQQKSAALTLKLAHLELVTKMLGEPPILMLDEVLAELDDQRSRSLFDAIHPDVQCLVTTAGHAETSEVVGRGTRAFLIDEGSLSELQTEADRS